MYSVELLEYEEYYGKIDIGNFRTIIYNTYDIVGKLVRTISWQKFK